ncbi:MAG TPA: hypothetical protein VHA73_15990 [Acidimicrobiales bacterium]|nr:hypothetical protein [Acidimicrobiales bacterium]
MHLLREAEASKTPPAGLVEQLNEAFRRRSSDTTLAAQTFDSWDAPDEHDHGQYPRHLRFATLRATVTIDLRVNAPDPNGALELIGHISDARCREVHIVQPHEIREIIASDEGEFVCSDIEPGPTHIELVGVDPARETIECEWVTL